MAVGRNNVLPRIRTAYTLEGKVALALCQQEKLSGLSVGKGIAELSRIHVTRWQKYAAYLVDKIGDILHHIRFLARNIFLSKTTLRTRLSDSRTRTRVVKLT